MRQRIRTAMTDIHFLDGGLGQEIQNRATARPHPLWSVKVMYDEPDVVSAVHRDFISAGARVITANTYTASPPRLRRDGDISQIGDIHNTALRLARAAIDKADDPALQLAGCLPPLVGSYVAEVSLDFEASLADYRQLVALQKDGVDLFLIETISNIAEARAALTAVKEAGAPGFVGLTICDDNNPCTDDVADELLGCLYAPNADDCDDGTLCTAGDACLGGECLGVDVDCSDGDTFITTYPNMCPSKLSCHLT